MVITIEQVENGFIVRGNFPSDEEENYIRVFEDGDLGEVQNLAHLLRHIADQVGPIEGRYSKERVYVEVRPGDKYEAQE